MAQLTYKSLKPVHSIRVLEVIETRIDRITKFGFPFYVSFNVSSTRFPNAVGLKTITSSTLITWTPLV